MKKREYRKTDLKVVEKRKKAEKNGNNIEKKRYAKKCLKIQQTERLIMGRAIDFFNEYIFGVGVPLILIAAGIFFCIRLRFFHFLHPIKVIKALKPDGAKKGVSSFGAVSLALAGTLGVGNMVGVASAIALGGFGSIFWMWISALVAMVLKYAEIVLAMRHRRFDEEGRPYGAAMYYISDALGKKNLGRMLGCIFAGLCIFNAVSMGGMIQINSAASAVNGVFGIPPILVGIIFAVITVWTSMRGRDGILSVTEKLVPFMTLGFIVLSVAVIFIYPTNVLNAFSLIFKNAFSLKSGIGGVAGFLLSGSIRYGTMRGILSNEAGCGTAPAAHSVSNCRIPAKQGAWGIFEVFVDTILLCTLTATVIITAVDVGVLNIDNNFMMMTVSSYTSLLGPVTGYFIAISVLLFGLATVLCWAHYGIVSVKYISSKPYAKYVFIAVYSLFVCLGSVIAADFIWDAADISIGAMTVINIAVLIKMNREIKLETELYFGTGKKKDKSLKNNKG